jgi:hypothetical protein
MGSAAKRRTSGNFFEPDTLAANPPPDRVVPEEEALRRIRALSVKWAK